MSSNVRSFESLENLPQQIFRRLYQQPCTTLALFRRMLSNLAKNIVMAMLFNDDPLPMSFINAWIKPESIREKEKALSKLRRMHIVTEKNAVLTLDPTFRISFRRALTGGGDHRSFGVPCTTVDKHKVDVSFLDKYATEQWETILHFMVGNKTEKKPSDGVIKLLVSSGLMAKSGSRRPEITQAGFSFLLQDVNAQIWTLLLQYLEMAEELRMDFVEVLHFLMMLGSLELGQDYSREHLTPTQKNMLEDLADYGLVYMRKSTSDRYYPTRLATTLTSESTALRTISAGFDSAASKGSEEGFIIIETNYRLYAYTSSPLQIAVLGFFCKLTARYPNLVAGRISRQSIRAAIKQGITAEQIISYLTTNAHPQMRKNNPVLPPTVVDQIRLWQIEGERMKPSPGFLLKEFANAADFQSAVDYAAELDILIWRNDQKRWMFVSRYEPILDLMKRRAAAKKGMQL